MDKYIPLEDLNKKKLNRYNPFQDIREGTQFAKNTLIGTGKALYKGGKAVYHGTEVVIERINLARKRSGIGIKKLGKGEDFGFGGRNVGIKFNSSNPLGYVPSNPKQVKQTQQIGLNNPASGFWNYSKPKTTIRYRTKYITKIKYVYRKKRR